MTSQHIPKTAERLEHERQLLRVTRLLARLREAERFQREAIEAARPPHSDDVLEHERMTGYRAGLADGLGRAAKYVEELEAQHVELGRAARVEELAR